MHIKNRRGPKIDPRSTTVQMGRTSEERFFSVTY